MNESQQDLHGQDLRQKDLTGIELAGANLFYTNLSGVNLAGRDLSYADLKDANLEGADLRGANLMNADLEDANLRGANLEGANLSGAEIALAEVKGANLRGVNLKKANLNGIDWSEVCLQEADLSRADLSWINLERANLQGANLEGANLFEANLRDANLQGANLQGARIWHACLDGALLLDVTGLSEKQQRKASKKGAMTNAGGYYASVGRPYLPGIITYPEGMLLWYDSQSGRSLRIACKNPSQFEISEIQAGSVKLGLLEKNGIIFVFAKFGDLTWMSAVYREDETNPFVFEELTDQQQGYPLKVMLVNAQGGILEAWRLLVMPYKMAITFQKMVEQQRNSRSENYQERIHSIFANYSKMDLLRCAETYSLKEDTQQPKTATRRNR